MACLGLERTFDPARVGSPPIIDAVGDGGNRGAELQTRHL
jgi:hypothetical protein